MRVRLSRWKWSVGEVLLWVFVPLAADSALPASAEVLGGHVCKNMGLICT